MSNKDRQHTIAFNNPGDTPNNVLLSTYMALMDSVDVVMVSDDTVTGCTSNETTGLTPVVTFKSPDAVKVAGDHYITPSLYHQAMTVLSSPTSIECGVSETAMSCSYCNGNDKDVPCAYPSGNKPGCVRDKRLYG